MRRSNKILLIFGVLLASASFLAVMAFGSMGQPQAAADPEVAVVIASQDLMLGTTVTAEMLGTISRPQSEAVDTFDAPEELVGQVVRRAVVQGAALTNEDFQTGTTVVDLVGSLQPGLRAMAVPLSRVDSVGMLLQPGDFVDVVLTMHDLDGLNPVVVENPDSNQTGIDGGEGSPYLSLDEYTNNTSVKVIVQNVQVIAALPREVEDGNNESAAPTEPQPDLVAILAVQPQQVEVIRFAQLDGNVSLVLRAPSDYAQGQITTTGITLRELVDRWGVLPPAPITVP